MTEAKPVIIKLYPSPEEYLEAETAFLRAVGLCITQWAFVDRSLFKLFRIGIGAPTHKAAIVYYSQHTIGQRLRQVDALLKSILGDSEESELSKQWSDLRIRTDDLLQTRNVIAHQPTRRLGTSKNGQAVYIYGIHIEPFQRHLKKRHGGMKGKDVLETDDLIAHSEQVLKLEGDFSVFIRKINEFTRRNTARSP